MRPPDTSATVGVGHGNTVAVGHNENAESSMRGSDVDGAERYGPGSITSIDKLLHHARKPALGP